MTFGTWMIRALYLSVWMIAPTLAMSAPRLMGPSVPVEKRRSFTHSHNDYEQKVPLQTALDSAMDSVEADVWLEGGRLVVSHDGAELVGTLSELYFEPLDRLIQRHGAVIPHAAQPFLLWIELKQNDPRLLDAVHTELARWPWITRYEDGVEIRGPVSVVLTGDPGGKLRYLTDFRTRFADVDTHKSPDIQSPERFGGGWYALDYPWYFAWRGGGEMPPKERARLIAIVDRLHRAGKRVRFFNCPDVDTYWDVALQTGIDLINTDRPAAIREFLDLPVVPVPVK